jgi:hypothetical protein
MASHRLERCWNVLGLAAGGFVTVLAVGSLAGVSVQAATPEPCSHRSAATWHAVETANFRILSYGAQGAARETADACETLREQLIRQWLSRGAGPASWVPKCDIVLHPSDEAYLREVGSGGRNTVASSLIDRKQGRIVIRRIDIRSTQSNWQTAALGHELTHVVLADRFAGRSLPRWIDEGMAILADPDEKQRRHRQDLEQAVAARAEFRLLELVTLADYPAAHRWGAFYGQSASLVQFLVDLEGPEQFVDFVEVAVNRGYEQGLRQVYQFGIADLERRWHSQLSAPVDAVARPQPRPALRTAPPPGDMMQISARPVSLKPWERAIPVTAQ